MKFSQLAILTFALFFILATVWMFFTEQLLTQWGIEPTAGTGVISRRCAAFFAGIGVMCLFARNAEPSLPRYALAAGLSTISLILAVLGIVEWREGHVNGQILFAVFIELFLGIAFVLSNRSAKENFTDKRDRVNNK
ncbi:TPA: hypothetical protein PXN30_004291 [Yersinia enterocolitica]|uniref:hypothetical protein n=1 Tax=Yersinia TaxID=629 RepID=UPI00065A2303|nr:MULTISPECIES: hypothetical protein [Yersinia]ALG46267.1 hypothetical protein LI89_16540 [Yersinia enterocolitica]EKN3340379.1 hypothetical protein [Yersinia enterocolitica]EKN3445528.1 hypothetical protein [Yersinia enterocolitica]EKN3461715.1 hypothetical protein [Yersinia enterocolitica]EKN3502504.1 hypothetical protein [Yersinia enterocolitica]